MDAILHPFTPSNLTTLPASDHPFPCYSPCCSSFSEWSLHSEVDSNTTSQVSFSSQESLLSESSLGSEGSLSPFPVWNQYSDEKPSSIRICNTCILKDGNGDVLSIALVGNLLHAACKSADRRVCRFGMNGDVRAIVVAGDMMFSGHHDHKIRVWRMDSSSESQEQHQQLIATLPTLTDRIFSFMAPSSHVHVRRNRKELWVQHFDDISALAINEKDGILYSGSWDRSVKVWRLQDFKCLESFKAHDDAINVMEVSENGSSLYTAAADGKVKVWARKRMVDEKKKKKKKKWKHCLMSTLEGHKSAVSALALSNSSSESDEEAWSILYSGGSEGVIVVWVEIGREIGGRMRETGVKLRGHRHAILCMASFGEDMLCSGSADKSVRVWKRRHGSLLHSCVGVVEGHTAPIKSIFAVNTSKPQNFMIYTGSLDHELRVWSVHMEDDDAKINE